MPAPFTIKPPKLPRAIWSGLVLVAVPSFFLIALQTYNATAIVPEWGQSQRLVAHTLQVIGEARALDQDVSDAERGQRGFLITGSPVSLAIYSAGMKNAPAKLANLRKLTADNPEQQRRVGLIESGIGIEFNELQSAVEARQKYGFDAARRIVETNVGVDTMHVVTGLIDFVIAAENQLLGEREARLVTAERSSRRVNIIAIVLALAVMIFGTVLLARVIERDRRSLARLRESEERFRLLVSGVRDYAIFLLDPDGRVASWNEGAQRIKGYRPEEIIGHPYSCFFPAEEIASGMPDIELARAAAEGSVEAEGWRVRKDGSRFYANVLLTVLRTEDGSIRGFAKITRDVTERIAAQRELDTSREALAQAQKMEALGQLTGGVAHDFNNLLTVILGSIELLRRQVAAPDAEKTAGLLDAAKQAAEQGSALVRRLLAFSRRQMLAPQSVDVNRLVSGMSELLRRTLGEAIMLETVLEGGVWGTFVDPNQLESALLNLALNARDGMPQGGKLTIETGNVYLGEEYAAAQEEVTAGQYALVAISDTGLGMSKETMARAFEPFYTTKPEGRGTGLGLSQVHGFVKQSGGHVKLYSEPDHGTTIKIYLPRHTAADAVEKRERPKTPPSRSQGETVLVVEDETLVRMYGVEALRELGYAVLEAGDGPEALRVLEENPHVAVLFTDVGLPGGLNGRQLAVEARKRIPHLKVLFATGYAKNAIVHQGVLDAGVELLEKPFTIDGLGRKLGQMMSAG